MARFQNKTSLEHLVSVHVGALVAMSTCLVGLGLNRPVLPAVMLLAVPASLWLTDWTGRLQLNRTLSNVAMLSAVIFCVGDLFREEALPESMVIGRLLAYVEMVLLFQRKDLRTWVQLMILSLVQVTVASLLSQPFWFGVLGLVYVFFALVSLVLLFLQFERTYYDRPAGPRLVSRREGGAFRRFEVNWRRLGKIALATLVVGPLSLFLRYGESAEGAGAPGRGRRTPAGTGRWPLLSATPIVLAGRTGPPAPVGLTGELWTCVAKRIPATLLAAVVVFVLVPRMGRFEFGIYRFGWFDSNNKDTATIRTAGFSDEVVLGELGLLSDDMKKVAQVTFRRPSSKEPYRVDGFVYLRGVVLTRYANGQWKYHGPGSPRIRRVPPGLEDRIVLQEITVEPMDRRELFCVWPFLMESSSDFGYDGRSERLVRTERRRKEQFSYTLATTALVDGRMSELVPSHVPVETDHLLDPPPADMAGLRRLAAEWIAESNAREDDWAGQARYLESRLRDSERFAYSGSGVARDENLDPIEDFLINNPTGNCEYFATALALMLRCQGIPCRVVVGFKTDEYNDLEDAFWVRQSHAHTWVEAYLDPKHLPADPKQRDRFPDWSYGAWLRLDPTPARDLTGVQALFGDMENWLEWVHYLWENYVVGMTRQRQKELVYDPLSGSALREGLNVLHGSWWKRRWDQLRRMPGHFAAWLRGGRWRSWQGILAAALAFLVGYGAYRGARRLARWIRCRVVPQTDPAFRRPRRLVAFYRRLEAVLARHGFTRRPTQTQREFAAEAGDQLAAATGQPQVARLAAEITEAFYRVRFGGTRLDPGQLQSVEEALRKLDQAAPPNPRPEKGSGAYIGVL